MDPDAHATALLDLVSFKWLMAGRGWWVNLSRLQEDPGYLKARAERGLESGSPLLEQRSGELLAVLARRRCERVAAPSFV